MTFDVEVAGTADRTLRLLLADLVGDDRIASRHGRLVVTVPDQSALVAVVTCLNDMGVAIDQVHGHEPRAGAAVEGRDDER